MNDTAPFSPFWDPGVAFFASLNAVGMVVALAFLLLYGFKAHWWSSPFGWMMMSLAGTVLGLQTVIELTFVFQDYPFRWLARSLVYGAGIPSMGLAFVLLVRILYTEARRYREEMSRRGILTRVQKQKMFRAFNSLLASTVSHKRPSKPSGPTEGTDSPESEEKASEDDPQPAG